VQKRRIKETAAEIISTDSVGTFAQFLNDRKIAKKYWPLIIVDIIDSKDLKSLQKVTLNLIKKWYVHENLIMPSRDSHLLEVTGDVDINYALNFLTKWILNEEIDPIKHEFYYHELFYGILKNHGDKVLIFMC